MWGSDWGLCGGGDSGPSARCRSRGPTLPTTTPASQTHPAPCRLQQRLQAGQHDRPALADAGIHAAARFQLVVGDGQPHHVLVGHDVEGDPAVGSGIVGLRGGGPGDDQTRGRGAFHHFADQLDRARFVGAHMLPARTGLPVRDVFMAPVAAGDLGAGDGLEHLLWRGGDIDHVDEAGGLCGHRHSPSSSRFRSCSRLRRCCSNLRTQRS